MLKWILSLLFLGLFFNAAEAKINRLAAHTMGNVPWSVYAEKYNVCVTQSKDVSGILAAKNINPNLKIYQDVDINSILYLKERTDPFPKYTNDVYEYYLEPRIIQAIEMNLKLYGIDWFWRDSKGELIYVQNNNEVLGNWTDNCPKGKWGWTKGLTLVEAYIEAMEFVSSKSNWPFDGFHLDLGGNLSSSSLNVRNEVPNYWNLTERSYHKFVLGLESLDTKVLINSYGESWLWPGINTPNNDTFADGYKFERWLLTPGWQTNYDGHDKWLAFWNWEVTDVRGKYRVGYDYLAQQNRLDDILFQSSPRKEWPVEARVAHFNYAVGTFLLHASNENEGPYFMANLYYHSQPLNETNYPFVQWVNMEAIGQYYKVYYHSKPLYCRRFKFQGPDYLINNWGAEHVIIVNPHDEKIFEFEPQSATRINVFNFSPVIYKMLGQRW